MAISIRPADAADSSRVAALLGELGHPAQAGEVAARMATWARDPHSALLVACAGDVVAGMAALHAFPLIEYSARRGRLVALVVDSAFRGRGIGRALVAAAEDSARLLGCRDMEITSARYRGAAQELYAGLGYDDVCGRSARFTKML